MTEPESDKERVEFLANPSFKRITDALELALIGLDEVSDEYRKRIFVGLVSIQDLTDLYSFLQCERERQCNAATK